MNLIDNKTNTKLNLKYYKIFSIWTVGKPQPRANKNATIHGTQNFKCWIEKQEPLATPWKEKKKLSTWEDQKVEEAASG